MPPTKPQLATKAASEVRFPTWDELVAEATIELPPYQLTLPPVGDKEPEVIEIPVFSGEQYIQIVHAQRIGDAVGLFEAVFPDLKDRGKVIKALKGVHFPFFDKFTTKVLRYFYGLGIETEETSGNSPAS